MAIKTNSKIKAHITYRLQNGDIVPGVTTITRQLNVEALKYWANNLGLKGINLSKYLEDVSSIGTLAHYLVMCHLKGEKYCADDYTPNQLDIAENSLIKFMDWEKNHDLKPVAIETPMVHELLKYGGTPDWIGHVDGVPEIIDLKTADAIYPEYWYQVAAYGALVITEDFMPQRYRILGLPRDNKGSFHEAIKQSLDHEKKVFLKLLELYYVLKEK